MSRSLIAIIVASAMVASRPAAAELVVSQLIVEFKPGAPKASDVEVSNNSPERAYVLVEARELLNPGMPSEKHVTTPDPTKLGLLVSPVRFILEPQQRRTLRIATIGNPTEQERVYRVTIKPVSGEVASSESGLKLLVGYDLLVLARPPAVRKEVRVERTGMDLTLTNVGNASVELAEGKQCDARGACVSLPGKRLYAGASWRQRLPQSTQGEYQLRSADGWSSLKF
ncbi:MAG: fimbria/pilus periplasmic chaperone [Pseudomonadota bacterium]|nr:fimbria/pilus periplasmic chaperone [Pseudomonadota bacterium]